MTFIIDVTEPTKYEQAAATNEKWIVAMKEEFKINDCKNQDVGVGGKTETKEYYRSQVD